MNSQKRRGGGKPNRGGGKFNNNRYFQYGYRIYVDIMTGEK